MGGLGPGIGGMEYVIIAIVALLVVGPERLPAMLHKLGKLVAKARNMAGEFRASFDEMARQSELDELRKEVEALRQGQMVPLGAEAEAAFREIRDDLNRPFDMQAAPNEWPDGLPAPPLPEPEPKPKASSKAKRASPASSGKTSPVEPGIKARAKAKPASAAARSPAKPRTTRAKKVNP